MDAGKIRNYFLFVAITNRARRMRAPETTISFPHYIETQTNLHECQALTPKEPCLMSFWDLFPGDPTIRETARLSGVLESRNTERISQEQ